MSELTVVYPRIEAAHATVEEEMAVVDAEAEAFDRFRSRLTTLEPVVSTRATGAVSPVTTTTVSGVDPRDVTAAYRETVMATEHYEREYDEPLPVHVATEFGTPIQDVVTGDVPLSSTQIGVVQAAAERAVEERRQFSRVLATECDSLATVNRRLGEIERLLYEWRAGTEAGGRESADDREASTPRQLAADCEALSAERQRALHRGPASALAGIGEMSLTAYLYDDREYRFPALVEIADVAERVEAAIDR